MTNGEAIAVNTVLRALGIRSPHDKSKAPLSIEVAEAAELLAAKANRALYAGIRPDDVRKWERRRTL